MSQHKKIFTKRHVVLPVIHVASTAQALRNARIAREAGCDGIFLINHGIPFSMLLTIHHIVYKEFPGWWIGVNCLDLSPKDVFDKINNEVAGVWVDNAMIDECSEKQFEAETIQAARIKSGWQGLYFGGVAFKYQRPVQDLQMAARMAKNYMDVVTTSGPGTGQAAPRQKILSMKQALGDFPLAIASGITPGNINDYLSIADCFLVATGISRNFTELDPSLLREISEKIQEYCRHINISKPVNPQRDMCIRSVCFICKWNEGRSVHLELSVRNKLRSADCRIQVCSAGFCQGGTVNALRREYLRKLGIPYEEIDAHHSTVFGPKHCYADLILVAELPMKNELLAQHPELRGKVMTVRGFSQGFYLRTIRCQQPRHTSKMLGATATTRNFFCMRNLKNWRPRWHQGCLKDISRS